jgi:hypothetical protein
VGSTGKIAPAIASIKNNQPQEKYQYFILKRKVLIFKLPIA